VANADEHALCSVLSQISLKQEGSRFFEKSGAKNFCWFGPAALKPARPRVKKVFLFLFVHKKKSSSSLRQDPA
jgi:hypothetical protein